MAVIGNTRKQNSLLKGCAVLLISGLLIAVPFGTCLAAMQDQEIFASPDEAVKALVDALKTFDTKALSAIFGPGSKDVISSGDPTADKRRGSDLSIYTHRKASWKRRMQTSWFSTWETRDGHSLYQS